MPTLSGVGIGIDMLLNVQPLHREDERVNDY